MKTIILASNNKDKVAEISAMAGDRFKIISMKEAGIEADFDETGTTFKENALIKAKGCYALTNLPCIADDSGLCVDALGGEPGVYTAEYAARVYQAQGKSDALKNIGHYSQNMSDANVDVLLHNMKEIADRRAKFVCCMVYYDGKDTFVATGETHGEIQQERIGTGGFGYDPIFYSHEVHMSFGLASFMLKNSVSHRRRALEGLFKRIM